MTARFGIRRRRGEPLLALALLLGGWTGARIMLWEPPFARAASSASRPKHRALRPLAVVEAAQLPLTGQSGALVSVHSARLSTTRTGSIVFASALPDWTRLARASSDPVIAEAQPTVALPSPAQPALAVTTPAQLAQPLAILPAVGPGRWHLTAWAAWRQGSGLPPVASGPRPASYGGSQMGALLQYDLNTGPHRPALHVRAVYSPDRPRQGEIAAGAGLRPVSKLPVRVMAELRATRSSGSVEVRPAVLAVTELAPVKLPLDLAAEGYAQGGWVGGRNATAFADGQARLTREVSERGPVRVKLGAGAWGGAQKFARRLDVGPTVSVDLGRGAVSARASLDYRVRVAGNASPGDGVAFTLSTGF